MEPSIEGTVSVHPKAVRKVLGAGGRAIKRLRRIAQFSKPKGSGLEISPGCYVSVLAAKAQLPSLLVLLNPKGEGGAIAGMGVPLAPDSTKAELVEPIKRGVYALS